MSIEPQYERLYREVEDLEHRVHDSTDRPDDSAAEQLERHIIALRDGIESNRKPRDIENRIKQIQSILDRAKHTTGSYMSISDADRYYRIFEDMRMGLRRYPNY